MFRPAWQQSVALFTEVNAQPLSRGGFVALISLVTFQLTGLSSAAGDQDPDPSPAPAASPATDRFGDPLPEGAVLRLGTTRLRHRGATAIAFSPDGRVLASGSRDSIRLWDAATGRRISELPHGAASLAFSPDGEYLAIGGHDDAVHLVSTADHRVVFTDFHAGLRGSSPVGAVAFFPDGRTLASAGRDGEIVLRDVSGGDRIHVLHQGADRNSSPTRLAISPDGRLIASASRKTIRVWRVEDGHEMGWLERSDGGDSTSLVFSPDGKSLLSGALRFAGLPAAKLEVRRWDSDTGEQLGEFLQDAPSARTVDVALAADRQSLIAAAGREVLIIELAPTALQRKFDVPVHGLAVTAVAVSPDGLLATTGVMDTAIGLWDVRTGQPRLNLADSHTAGLTAVDYSPDGSRVVTGSRSGTLRLWNAASGEQVRQFAYSDRHCNLKSVAFSRKGELIAAAGNYSNADWEAIGAVKLWNANTGELIHEFQLDETMFGCIAFSPDGRYLAASPDYTQVIAPRRPFAAADVRIHVVAEHPIYLFRIDRGERMRTLSGHDERVVSLGFNADGSSLVAITHCEGIHIWSLADGTRTRSIPAPDVRSAAISSDATFAVTTSIDSRNQMVSLSLWDLADDAEPEPREFGGFPSGHASLALDISGDGNLLAVGSGGGTATLWDLRTRRELTRFSAPDSRVYPLALSPSGEHLVTGMDDGSAVVWSASRAGQNAVNSPLSPPNNK